MRSGVAGASLIAVFLLAVACQSKTRMPTSPTASPTVQTETISGVVLDNLANPIQGASADIVDSDIAVASSTTDPQGRFSLTFQRVVSQSFAVRVTKAGFHPVTVRNPSSTQLQVRLLPTELMALEAAYTMTIEATACDGIPAGLRRRSYSVAIASSQTYSPLFSGALGDATFYPGYGTISLQVGADGAKVLVFSRDAFENWLEDHPIFERVGQSGYLSMMGSAQIRRADGGRSNGAFDGSYTYCPSAQVNTTNNWPPTCAVAAVTCESRNHQFSFVSR